MMPNDQLSTKCNAENSVAANFKKGLLVCNNLMQTLLFFTIPRAVTKSSVPRAVKSPPGPFYGILALLTDFLD